jgi:hypothetical protein
MNHKALIFLTVGVCTLLMASVYPGIRNEAAVINAHDNVSLTGEKLPIKMSTVPGSIVQTPANPSRSCLAFYDEPRYVLTVNATSPMGYEPYVTAGDFNGDGLEDVVITKMAAQTYQTYGLDFLLNNGNGSLVLGTSSVFLGTVPAVQHPRQVVIADFNGDGVSDIFVADHGYDLPPFPGYQNSLVLTAPDGKLVNANGNLPQQNDFTHSAAAADIDGDEDVDLYIGNIWGQNKIPPQIWLNDGSGTFSLATGRLPYPIEDLDFGTFTASAFVDINNDESPDLILGYAGADLAGGKESLVLLNNGSGYFSKLAGAIPQPPFFINLALYIVAIDLNDDGYQDLIITYTKQEYYGQYIQILINNQDGTFRDETSTRLPQSDNNNSWIRLLELRDMDHDGGLDLLARPFDGQNPGPLLFLNDGSGIFSRQPFDYGFWSLYYTFLDLDGDGGNDIVSATYAPPEDIYIIRDLGCPVFLPFVSRN